MRRSMFLFTMLALLVGSSVPAEAHHDGGRNPVGGVKEEICVVDMFGRQCFFRTGGLGTFGPIPLEDDEGGFSVPMTGGVHGGRSANRRVVIVDGESASTVRVQAPSSIHLDGGFLCYETEGSETTRLCAPLGERRPTEVVLCAIKVPEDDPDPGSAFAGRGTLEKCEFVRVFRDAGRLPSR
ncbi:MAG: hypothetical protein AAB367_00535 [Patescibacteria group bacterium]